MPLAETERLSNPIEWIDVSFVDREAFAVYHNSRRT
jgi:hypothetical protein